MSIYKLCVPETMDSPLLKRKRPADTDSHSSWASQSSGASAASAGSTLYSSDSASSAGKFGTKTREKTDSKCVYVVY